MPYLSKNIAQSNSGYYLWKNIETFVLKSKSSKDRLLRVIVANKFLNHYNESLITYLNDKQNDITSTKLGSTVYSCVKYSDIIENSHTIYNTTQKIYFSNIVRMSYLEPLGDSISSFRHRIQNGSDGVSEYALLLFGVSCATFIAIPVWILTRIFIVKYNYMDIINTCI